MAQSFENLKKELNSKTTFISACSSLEKEIGGSENISEELFTLISRAQTVLSARYTAVAYWKAGLSLFETAKSHSTNPTHLSKLNAFISQAKAHLEEENKEPTASTQQSSSSSIPNNNEAADFIRAALNGMTTGATTGQANEDDDDEATQGGRGERLVDNPMDFVLNFLSDVTVTQAMLDQMQSFAASADDVGPPPASRDARHNLPIASVKEHDVTCPVCQETLPPGSKAKQLPCTHLFHSDCVLEWLEKHNTCPMCRYELPTEKRHFDDIRDRIAAANAAKTSTNIYS